MLNGDVYPYPNYFHNITGSNDYDNFLRTNAPEVFGWCDSSCHPPTFGPPCFTCLVHSLCCA